MAQLGWKGHKTSVEVDHGPAGHLAAPVLARGVLALG